MRTWVLLVVLVLCKGNYKRELRRIVRKRTCLSPRAWFVNNMKRSEKVDSTLLHKVFHCSLRVKIIPRWGSSEWETNCKEQIVLTPQQSRRRTDQDEDDVKRLTCWETAPGPVAAPRWRSRQISHHPLETEAAGWELFLGEVVRPPEIKQYPQKGINSSIISCLCCLYPTESHFWNDSSWSWTKHVFCYIVYVCTLKNVISEANNQRAYHTYKK